MSKIKNIPNPMMPIFGVVLFSLVFVGGAYFVLSAGSQPKVNIINYSKVDKNKPIIEVGETSYDMGIIKVSNTKVKEFNIRNVGSRPLLLWEISSSCGCTKGQIIYKKELIREFSMHSAGSYVAQIEPNTSAIIKVVYMPFTMPVYGAVERQVFMSTNDPNKPKLEFRIKANVQK